MMDQTAPTLNPKLKRVPAPKPESIRPPRRGDVCPNCGAGKLDYNGVLDLACENCGYSLSGGAGCT
jgi:uncharacterized protein (DUF983 family)